MPFQFHIDILDIILKGILIGICASAPMGPVGVLCVQRTLNKGRWYGFATGIGAAASDLIYALITGLGMSFVMDLITNQQNKFFLQITGSILLLGFGIYCWRTNPTKNMHISGYKKGSLTHNFSSHSPTHSSFSFFWPYSHNWLLSFRTTRLRCVSVS